MQIALTFHNIPSNVKKTSFAQARLRDVLYYEGRRQSPCSIEPGAFHGTKVELSAVHFRWMETLPTGPGGYVQATH